MTTTTVGRRVASFAALIVLGLGGATTATVASVRADSAVFSRGTAPAAAAARRA